MRNRIQTTGSLLLPSALLLGSGAVAFEQDTLGDNSEVPEAIGTPDQSQTPPPVLSRRIPAYAIGTIATFWTTERVSSLG